MTGKMAITGAEKYFDQGDFYEDLARRIAIPSTSQDPDKRPALYAYLTEEIGYDTSFYENPDPLGGPLLIAERHEGANFTTVLTYGYGDVVRGHEGKWRDGRSPWKMEKQGDRWYGAEQRTIRANIKPILRRWHMY